VVIITGRLELIRGGMILKRLWIVLTLLFIFVPSAAAANKLEIYNQAAEAQQSVQIYWKLSGLGKLSGDMVLAPNRTLILPLGSKIVCVDLQGKVLWESKASSSGKTGQPLIAGEDSIYTAGASSIQEIKLNGTNAWSFSIYSAAKGAKTPLLASGSDNLLYLPLPNGLYAVNVSGRYVWMLSPWDSSENHATKLNTDREFVTCVADKQAFYIVYGEKKDYRLSAISKQGEFLWTFGLGDVTSTGLLPGEDGQIFVAVNYEKSSSGKQSSSLKPGRIYSFRNGNENSPEWKYSFKTDGDLSAPVGYKDHILYLTGGDTLYAFNTDTRSIIWRESLLNLVSLPVIDPQTGHIYAGSSDGELFAVDQAGRLVWERTMDGSIDQAPVVGADGFLYVSTQKGSLYKIKDNVK